MFVASDPWTHSLRRDYSFISLSFHPFFSHACFLCRLAGCNRWNLKTFRLAVCSGFGLTMRYTFICSSLLSGLAHSWSMNFSFRATVICLLFEKDVEAYIQCLAETLRITDEISIVQFSEASFCNRFSTCLASRYVLICIPVSFKLALQLGIWQACTLTVFYASPNAFHDKHGCAAALFHILFWAIVSLKPLEPQRFLHSGLFNNRTWPYDDQACVHSRTCANIH